MHGGRFAELTCKVIVEQVDARKTWQVAQLNGNLTYESQLNRTQ